MDDVHPGAEVLCRVGECIEVTPVRAEPEEADAVLDPRTTHRVHRAMRQEDEPVTPCRRLIPRPVLMPVRPSLEIDRSLILSLDPVAVPGRPLIDPLERLFGRR